MYVIFPADELIYMTYGIAVPRFKPRPTLDNLREPTVPFGETLSSPSSSLPPLPPLPPLPSNQRQRKSSIQKSEEPEEYQPQRLQPYQKYKEEQLQLLQQQQQQLQNLDHSSATLSRRPSRSSNNSNNSKKQIQFRQSPERTSSCTRTTIPNQQSVIEQNLDSDYLPISEDYERMSDFQEEEYMRERSPSIFLEPSTPGPSSSRQQQSLFPSSKSNPSTPKSSSKTSKLRPKLNISLGRLGRQQPEQLESARLKEDLKLHVENPIFNRENLRQRNFDAFFESGEPVYSLEKHIRSSTSTPDELYTTSNYASSSTGGNLGSSGGRVSGGGGGGSDYSVSAYKSNYDYSNHSNASGNNSIASNVGMVATTAQKSIQSGLFSRSSKNSPLSSRSRSVEPFSEQPTMYTARSADVPQKGDSKFFKIIKWGKRT